VIGSVLMEQQIFEKIVIKIGTSSITYPNGKLNLHQIEILTGIIADLINSGKQVILVTSGAIGAGMGILKLRERPHEIAMKQAVAATGQAYLMQIYQRYFSRLSINCAQILLTKDVLDDPVRKQNVKQTLAQLFQLGVVPIVNENDTVSTDEIEGVLFSDNDQLSSIVSVVSDADLLLIYTTIDGLIDDQHNVIKHVSNTKDVTKYVSGTTSTLGTGGMLTKLTSIQYAMDHGITCVICNSNKLQSIYDILNGIPVGTTFKGGALC